MLRRMAPGVKMSLHAAMQAMQEARITQLDAIITGTGLGCLQDSEKFLNAVLDQDEEYLAPTSFIQSTHNAVGAQIAIHLGCKAYNFTYVQGLALSNRLYWTPGNSPLFRTVRCCGRCR